MMTPLASTQPSSFPLPSANAKRKKMDSLLKLGSLSLEESAPQKWQLWNYECKDIPIHDHYFNEKNGADKECLFCLKVKELQSYGQTRMESREHFDDYIQKGRQFPNANSMLRFVESVKERIFPSQLAKSVYFNCKLGAAFFRDGIHPNKENPANVFGGNFQLLLMGTTGNKDLLAKFDQIFKTAFKMIVNKLDEGKPFSNAINGIFIRCEMNPGKNIAKDAYKNLMNLPLMVKLEVWIGNNREVANVKKGLVDEIANKIYKMELTRENCRGFLYNLADRERIRLWLYECPDRPYHKNKDCLKEKCPFCTEVSKHFDGKKHRMEAYENWNDYIKEDELFRGADLGKAIENNKEKLLPSFLAKSIFFNRKLGAAFFRPGIEPSYEHPLNIPGGNFQFLLFGNAGNEKLLAKFDQIFQIFVEGISNSPDKMVADSINGIFIRCEVKPHGNDYSNVGDLPFMFKLEVWIRKHYENEKLKSALIKGIMEKMHQMGLPEGSYRDTYNYRSHKFMTHQ